MALTTHKELVVLKPLMLEIFQTYCCQAFPAVTAACLMGGFGFFIVLPSCCIIESCIVLGVLLARMSE